MGGAWIANEEREPRDNPLAEAEDAIRNADHIIDIGPGAGVHGGEVVVSGTMQDVIDSSQSLTGAYLSGERSIAVPAKRHAAKPKHNILSLLSWGSALRRT